MWVGTQGGLARWDGYRFRVYQPVPNQPHSLPDNNVLCLLRDASGRLWVGTLPPGTVTILAGTRVSTPILPVAMENAGADLYNDAIIVMDEKSVVGS